MVSLIELDVNGSAYLPPTATYSAWHRRITLSVRNTAAVEASATGSSPFFIKERIRAAAIPAKADHMVAVEYRMAGKVIAPSTA